MARKTFHHLTVGTQISVEVATWDDAQDDLKVLRTVKGTVDENRPEAKTLRVALDDSQSPRFAPGFPMMVVISKQSGGEWGGSFECGNECCRIAAAHAQKKA